VGVLSYQMNLWCSFLLLEVEKGEQTDSTWIPNAKDRGWINGLCFMRGEQTCNFISSRVVNNQIPQSDLQMIWKEITRFGKS
jgi:hypothetical protein